MNKKIISLKKFFEKVILMKIEDDKNLDNDEICVEVLKKILKDRKKYKGNILIFEKPLENKRSLFLLYIKETIIQKLEPFEQKYLNIYNEYYYSKENGYFVFKIINIFNSKYANLIENDDYDLLLNGDYDLLSDDE